MKKELVIKVCGMREYNNVQAVASFLPDYMGFIFYSKSPRYVGDINPDVFDDLKESVIKVGVFVNASSTEILEKKRKYGFELVQLHGDESPGDCAVLKSKGLKVIKAIAVSMESDIQECDAFVQVVDYFLFDTKGKNYGGHGVTFDWGLLKTYQLDIPFFISGGIGLEEMKALPEYEQLIGVDLNSKFEIEPGLKDVDALEQGFKLVRG